jgi:hypothetical protein
MGDSLSALCHCFRFEAEDAVGERVALVVVVEEPAVEALVSDR